MDVFYIEDIRLFKRLSPRAINALAGLFVLKRWSKGDTILRQGTQSNGVYLILEGEASGDSCNGNRYFYCFESPPKRSDFGTCLPLMAALEERIVSPLVMFSWAI